MHQRHRDSIGPTWINHDKTHIWIHIIKPLEFVNLKSLKITNSYQFLGYQTAFYNGNPLPFGASCFLQAIGPECDPKLAVASILITGWLGRWDVFGLLVPRCCGILSYIVTLIFTEHGGFGGFKGPCFNDWCFLLYELVGRDVLVPLWATASWMPSQSSVRGSWHGWFLRHVAPLQLSKDIPGWMMCLMPASQNNHNNSTSITNHRHSP